MTKLIQWIESQDLGGQQQIDDLLKQISDLKAQNSKNKNEAIQIMSEMKS